MERLSQRRWARDDVGDSPVQASAVVRQEEHAGVAQFCHLWRAPRPDRVPVADAIPSTNPTLGANQRFGVRRAHDFAGLGLRVTVQFDQLLRFDAPQPQSRDPAIERVPLRARENDSGLLRLFHIEAAHQGAVCAENRQLMATQIRRITLPAGVRFIMT